MQILEIGQTLLNKSMWIMVFNLSVEKIRIIIRWHRDYWVTRCSWRWGRWPSPWQLGQLVYSSVRLTVISTAQATLLSQEEIWTPIIYFRCFDYNLITWMISTYYTEGDLIIINNIYHSISMWFDNKQNSEKLHLIPTSSSRQ